MINLDRFKELREDHDLTQQEMANILGVSKSAYNFWEYGTKSISLIKLNRFCNYFNISLDYICGFTDTKNYKILNKSLNKKIIGKRIREIRNENNDKQETIANVMGINRSTYSRYETGQYLVLFVPLIRFCKYYNVSVDYVCGKSKDRDIN